MEHHITCLNLSSSDIKKLKSAGYNYCTDLRESVLNSQQIDLPQVPLTKSALLELEEELKNGFILSYNADLDQVLQDEISPKRITELTGLPGTGKSQISFQLCVTVQLPKIHGGLEGEAVYINTNNNLASHRIRQLAERFLSQIASLGLNSDITSSIENIMKHIYVFKCYDFIDLLATVKYFEEFLKGKRIKLIVIDSISNPIRGVCQEERINILHSILSDLQLLSSKFNFAIVITNDYTVRIYNNETLYVPSFGDGLQHRVNSRIVLSKKGNIHYAELVKSIIKPYTKVAFNIL
ncbi:hypothetical protein GWI33_012033 [Rhynchophorus ferrugineus]|uniref:DNA repair protein RAD51 homolog 3 n=1 Tax=Rhynchophorus ferrugineus TaxID=354439 RepID=A0A834MEH3_RHYFE|nr:hypothetical protein GWI33_012033 [Rhynchophorus ferrugineus]